MDGAHDASDGSFPPVARVPRADAARFPGCRQLQTVRPPALTGASSDADQRFSGEGYARPPDGAVRRAAADPAPGAECPQCLRARPGHGSGHHPPRRGVPAGLAETAALSTVNPSQFRPAGPVLLCPDQPALHPRPASGQEHRPPLSGAGVRRLPAGLGSPLGGRSSPDDRGLRMCLPEPGDRLHPG